MDPAKLKVVELRAELSKRSLETKGNKAVLVERLRQALDEESGNEPTDQTASSPEAESEREKTPEPPKSTKTPSRPVRSTRHLDQSNDQQDSPVPRTPTRGATRASTRAVTPDKKPPVKSPVVEKANELPTITETPGEEASPQKEGQTSLKKVQRKQEESSSDAPVTTDTENTEKSHVSPGKQETHVSPVKVLQELKTSPVKVSQEIKTSPVKVTQEIKTSPVNVSQELKASPIKVSQDLKASPVKVSQDVKASPVKVSQDVKASPITVSQDLKASPVKPAQTAVSPTKCTDAAQQSPAKPIQIPQQSPAKPIQAAQQSPVKPVPVVQQSPVKPSQVAEQSPIKSTQAVQDSPVKPAQPILVSPVKSAAEPLLSPVKSNLSSPVKPTIASPVKSTIATPVKTEQLASPAKSEQQTSPVKLEQQKSPAKSEQQKSPAKSEQQKSPAKSEELKSPVKSEQQKIHAKSEEQKSSVKLEQQKIHAKSEEQKSPVKSEQQKSHAKSEEQKSPVKSEQQKSHAKSEEQKSPAKVSQEIKASPVKHGEEPMETSQEASQSAAKISQPVNVVGNVAECTEDSEMKDDEEDPGCYAHLITSEEEIKAEAVDTFDEEMDSSDKYDHELEVKDDLKKQDEKVKNKVESIKGEKTVEVKPDRKRKRSPSPEEELKKIPSLIRPEDEPELDKNTVALSWYDSDLNLVIKKEGFFSATPMHNDGFGYVWAGARATYGFRTGKVFYEVKITENCHITLQDEENPHLLRAGWSVIGTSMQLGEEPLSFGFDGTGKKSTNNEFSDYGQSFNKDDVVGCYLDMSSDNVEMSYTVNGNSLGSAFTIPKNDLGDKALYPHILTKNCTFICNFGQEESWSTPTLEGYVYVGKVDLNDRVLGPQRPEKKEDCEMLMLCGLPGSGKTYWSMKYAAEHPDKMYNILGTNTLIEKMKVMGIPRKANHQGKWEVVIDKCSRALTKLVDVAARRRRNYILDQNNVYLTAQKRKMRYFQGFQRKAIVVIPSDEEFQARSIKPEYVEYKCTENTIQEMKANFAAPSVGDSFIAVEYVELGKEEAKNVIEKYNKEAKEAGFGQQHEKKRSRFEKADHRDVRSSRDGRERDNRRSGYSDRNRNSSWRGGGGGGGGGSGSGGSSGGGWRDRNQRSDHRYRGSNNNWRGRGGSGGSLQPHRGDRRGNDRRSSNDRNRSSSRSGGWGQVGYQGSQSSSSWGGQQGSWSGGQQSGWNQQGGSNWGSGQNQWGGNWKGYGQGYSQSSYGHSNYGNGNWNSWNQQYYNQYWGQNQPSGQTTTASGQATNTPAITSSSTKDTDEKY